jgi:hypothetical protein
MLHARRSVLAVLIASVCLALAIPAFELWHAFHTPIQADITVMTTHALLNRPVTMLVTLDDVSVSLAQATELQAQTDMASMHMFVSPQHANALPGRSSYRITWSYPMAGSWWVECSLAMPGYAPWHQRVTIEVEIGPTGGQDG